MKLSKEFIAMFREEAKKAQWEINRWNGKSIDDLVVDYLERKELKPEDFKGVVVLTSLEATICLEAIKIFKEVVRQVQPNEVEHIAVFEYELKERIEQAEGKE